LFSFVNFIKTAPLTPAVKKLHKALMKSEGERSDRVKAFLLN